MLILLQSILWSFPARWASVVFLCFHLLLYMGKPHISIVNSHKSKPHILCNIYGVNPLFFCFRPPIIIDVKMIAPNHRTGGRSAGERM